MKKFSSIQRHFIFGLIISLFHQSMAKPAELRMFVCPKENGFFPIDPYICSNQYYICVAGVETLKQCPAAGLFDPTTNKCHLASNCIPLTTTVVTSPPSSSTPSTITRPTTSTPSTIKSTTTSSTTSVPTTSSSVPFSCHGKHDGLYADPLSCKFYYKCYNGHPCRLACKSSLASNHKLNICNCAFNFSTTCKKKG